MDTLHEAEVATNPTRAVTSHEAVEAETEDTTTLTTTPTTTNKTISKVTTETTNNKQTPTTAATLANNNSSNLKVFNRNHHNSLVANSTGTLPVNQCTHSILNKDTHNKEVSARLKEVTVLLKETMALHRSRGNSVASFNNFTRFIVNKVNEL